MFINKHTWRDVRFLLETPADGGAPSATAQPDTDPSSQGDDDEAFDKPRALATITKLREFEKEANRLRKELDAVKVAEDKRKEAEMTVVQLAEKRAQEAQAARDALEQRYRTNAIHSAVRLAAATVGFVNPEHAVKLADLSAVELGEDDKVTGAEDAVKALAKVEPHLLKSHKPTAPNIDGTPGGEPPNQTTKQIAESQLNKAYKRG